MNPTITTRFRCRRPLTDLTQLTLMFLTLILQYLNKLVEGKVRDFTSPKPFHAVKVQGFNRNRIKLLTEFACQLPMKVFALIRDFPIETGDLSYTPPPTTRAFDFMRKAFVEGSQFLQGLFQRLRVLFLFTRVQRQIRVFHTEVCPNAFTYCRQRFEVGVGCCYANPIVTASITFDGNTTHSSMPLVVFMESIWHFIKPPLTLIPFAKCERDTILFQRPPRLTGVGNRLKLIFSFDFRSATEFFEKTDIRCVNPF